MKKIIEEIVESSHLLFERQNVLPITKTNQYLYNVSHLCVTHRELIGKIPAADCGYLGFAYMHILSLTNEPIVLQTYSTMAFYFNEKFLEYGCVGELANSSMHVQTLNDALIVMNIGARFLCRTFAQAQGIEPSAYVDFNNLKHLPMYVKQILLCEFSYFAEIEEILTANGLSLDMDEQMHSRCNFIENLVLDGYFGDIGAQDELYGIARKLRKEVFEYASRKIDKGEMLFC